MSKLSDTDREWAAKKIGRPYSNGIVHINDTPVYVPPDCSQEYLDIIQDALLLDALDQWLVSLEVYEFSMDYSCRGGSWLAVITAYTSNKRECINSFSAVADSKLAARIAAMRKMEEGCT